MLWTLDPQPLPAVAWQQGLPLVAAPDSQLLPAVAWQPGLVALLQHCCRLSAQQLHHPLLPLLTLLCLLCCLASVAAWVVLPEMPAYWPAPRCCPGLLPASLPPPPAPQQPHGAVAPVAQLPNEAAPASAFAAWLPSGRQAAPVLAQLSAAW